MDLRHKLVARLSFAADEEGSLFKAMVFRILQRELVMAWKLRSLPAFSENAIFDYFDGQGVQTPHLYERLDRPLLSQRRNVQGDQQLLLTPTEYLLFCFFHHGVLGGKRSTRALTMVVS